MKNQVNPDLAYNQMLYSTLRIQCENSIGTGFIFLIEINGVKKPLLVTNKHLVNEKQKNEITITLHLIDKDGEEENYNHTSLVEWVFHPNQDLCFTPFEGIVDKVWQQTKKKVNYIAIGEDLIPSQDILNNLSSVEEIVMVGYPIGLWDSVHNYPLFRHGYTSTHPAIDFEDRGIGIVDVAALPGSSGSPIFIRDSGISKQEKMIQYRDKLYLLGIQFATMMEDNMGELIVFETPTRINYLVKGKNPTNIGLYIRASCLMDFKRMIEK